MSDDLDSPTDEDRVHALQHDYIDLLHAIQSGCEYGIGGMHGDPRSAVPHDWAVQKHLRVGINNSIIGAGALCKLLIAKGVITELEYWTAIVDEFRASVAEYERELADQFGIKVTLR